MLYNYIKNMNFPPLILYRSDLLKLMEILQEPLKDECVTIEIIIPNKELNIIFDSVEEFKNYKEKDSLDKIKVIVSSYTEQKEKESHNYLTIDLDKISAKLYISSNDQLWYYKKTNQIIENFKKSIRWYSVLKSIGVPFLVITCIFSSFISQILSKNIYFIISISSIQIIFSIIIWLIYIVFPHSKIYLKEKEKLFTYESKTIIISIISLIIALISLIVNIIK